METRKDPVPANELAARLFVELVGRAAVMGEGSVKMSASVEKLAVLSHRLAEAFHAVGEQIQAAKAPKTTFKLDASDIAAWSK